ncbi:hypothetical protein [Thermomonospora umbrina]|uniref:Uncharacterized protein n=1 Tax=Thermomonospora umbrina TaxID=111806 RepID=A0A3D9SM35_9ACTN|nr:hypothetical protein [Thermomonospora umbrina]REE96982.1 hypothetical protein DFJ69_2436 [Thermomonospora umbrina]
MHDRTTPEARLAALAAHLKAHRLDVDLTGRGLLVHDPHSGTTSDPVTCRSRADDAGTLWFFTVPGRPLAPADRVTDAVTSLKAHLSARASS